MNQQVAGALTADLVIEQPQIGEDQTHRGAAEELQSTVAVRAQSVASIESVT